MTTPPIVNSISHSLPPITDHHPATPKPSEGGSLLTVLLLALCCFALSPTAQALLPAPPPDGGYPNGNTAEGTGALFSLTTGSNNTALGGQALYHDTTGSNNAATGFRTLYSNTTGVNNTATGSQALVSNSTGNQNTANGYVALSSNTSGASNTATGSGALHSNTSASHNTATGYISLYRNTTGGFNTGTGDRALYSNTTGTQNTATGYGALNSNTTASLNTANGYGALFSNTTGSDNDAVGASALGGNISGFQNVAMGSFALGTPTAGTASFNTALGFGAEKFDDGFFNTVVGYSSGQNLTAGFENIYIGDTIGAFSPAGINEVNTIRIGDLTGFNGITQCFIGGIANFPQITNGVTVCEVTVNGFGQLGVDCTHPNNPGGTTPQGPGAPVRPGAPQPRSAPGAPAQRPTMGQAMLNDRVEKLQATVAQQQKQIETLTAQLKEQAAQIQKVSAQLELSKPAPRTVLNKQ